MPDARLQRILDSIATLPEAEATTRTGQHYALEVRGKKFCYYTVDHHGDGRVALTVKVAKGENAELVASDPKKFFMPPYMAHHGYVGVYLDVGKVDWKEIREFIVDAFKLAAPKKLAALVD
jgi:phosphoribosylglycinamide formyltransferase-1